MDQTVYFRMHVVINTAMAAKDKMIKLPQLVYLGTEYRLVNSTQHAKRMPGDLWVIIGRSVSVMGKRWKVRPVQRPVWSLFLANRTPESHQGTCSRSTSSWSRPDDGLDARFGRWAAAKITKEPNKLLTPRVWIQQNFGGGLVAC